MKTLRFAFFVILLMSGSLQVSSQEYLIGKKLSIESQVLNETRELIVHLPTNYQESKNDYPVLYLLDGRTHFEHAVAACNYLKSRGLAPDMIVVAIVNIDRTRDFSPTHVEKRPTTGGAPKFINFIDKELVPYINENYKAADYRILMGHSFGGTFTAYALLENPELFSAFIAISPYLMYDENHMVNEMKARLKDDFKNPKLFYMTVGDEPDYLETLASFEEIIINQAPKSIALRYDKMPNENHGTTPYLSLFNGLRFVYRDWQLPKELMNGTLEQIDAHYKLVSTKYGIEISTPENVINFIGYQQINANDLSAAITIFSENVKRYPNSANVYDSLGEAYEKSNDLKKAKENFQKAYEIGLKNLDPNTLVFKSNLDRVSQ